MFIGDYSSKHSRYPSQQLPHTISRDMQQKPAEDPPAYSPSQTYSYGPRPGQSSSTEAEERTVDVQGPMFRGPDVEYLKTPCGIAKIVQAVSEMILIINDSWRIMWRGNVFSSICLSVCLSVCL